MANSTSGASPAPAPAKEKVTAQQQAAITPLEFTTIPFDGIPMTQAITEGYPGALSAAEVAALPKAKIIDFKANFSYEYPVRVGVINSGTAEVPVFEDMYQMKKVNVYTDIVTGSIEFYNAVMAGNAYNPGAAVVTTAPPTVPVTTVPV